MCDEAVLMVGSGGHGRVLADIIRRSSEIRLVGIIDDIAVAGTQKLGSTVLGGSAELPRIMAQTGCRRLVLAIGHNGRRLELAERIESLCEGVVWQSLCHPSVIVGENVEIGPGSVVTAGAVINPGSHLGRHCIVNTSAVVDHDCRLGDGSSLGPGALLGGWVTLGEGAIVAIGATVINGLQLGAHCLLGAGAMAVRDLPEQAVALGVPARVVRQRTAQDEYL